MYLHMKYPRKNKEDLKHEDSVFSSYYKLLSRCNKTLQFYQYLKQ